jgi:pilus assembly protein Flp/PilA
MMPTKLLMRFATDDSGATAMEYGIIAALMGVGLIAAFVAFGGSLANLFSYVDARAGAALNSAT